MSIARRHTMHRKQRTLRRDSRPVKHHKSHRSFTFPNATCCSGTPRPQDSPRPLRHHWALPRAQSAAPATDVCAAPPVSPTTRGHPAPTSGTQSSSGRPRKISARAAGLSRPLATQPVSARSAHGGHMNRKRRPRCGRGRSQHALGCCGPAGPACGQKPHNSLVFLKLRSCSVAGGPQHLSPLPNPSAALAPPPPHQGLTLHCKRWTRSCRKVRHLLL